MSPDLSIAATLEGKPAPADAAPAIVEKLWAPDAALPDSDVKRATCGTREGCAVLRERPAGTHGGRALSVVVLDLGEGDMALREYWVVARSAGSIVAGARIAGENVVAGKEGDESLTVGPNTMSTRLTWWPTSNWQSFPERTFQLWPPRMTAFRDSPHHRGGADVFGYNDLTFTTGAAEGRYHCDDGRNAEYLPIPASSPDPGLDPAKGLDQCSVIADGTKGHGYLLAGVADRASAHFRVAYLDALYVEVHDDHWTDGDGIEIHTGRPAGFMDCSSALTPAKKYSIDSGGVVKSPPGAQPLAVKVVRSDVATRTFRIELPEKLPGGTTVVQRDDDGDGTPLRSIATSPLDKSIELGDFTYTRAACARTAGGAALVPTDDW